jgi:hypothetical protein
MNFSSEEMRRNPYPMYDQIRSVSSSAIRAPICG